MQDKTGKNRKDKIIRAIIVGIITSAVSGIIVTYFELYAKYNWFGEKESSVRTAAPTPDGEEDFSSSEEVEAPPDIPQVPLKVIDYSSQKDSSWPASAVTDGSRETAWVSKPSSPRGQSLVLGTVDETLSDISFVQLCTASSKSQQAAMTVHSVTLFSSQELDSSRTLLPIGTYSFSQERTCHLFKFEAPTLLRVLVIQITENAGDPSVLVSEVIAYGSKHKVPL